MNITWAELLREIDQKLSAREADRQAVVEVGDGRRFGVREVVVYTSGELAVRLGEPIR